MVQVVKLPRFEKMLKIILNWKWYFLTETAKPRILYLVKS